MKALCYVRQLSNWRTCLRAFKLLIFYAPVVISFGSLYITVCTIIHIKSNLYCSFGHSIYIDIILLLYSFGVHACKWHKLLCFGLLSVSIIEQIDFYININSFLFNRIILSIYLSTCLYFIIYNIVRHARKKVSTIINKGNI